MLVLGTANDVCHCILALAMLAQSQMGHAKPEPLRIAMSDGLHAPYVPLIISYSSLMSRVEVHCDSKGVRVFGFQCYLG